MKFDKRILMYAGIGVAAVVAVGGIAVGLGVGKGSVSKNNVSGNSVVSGDDISDEFGFEEEEEQNFSTEYGSYSTGAEWGNNWEGSAVFLKDSNAIVTIAVDTEDQPFNEDDLKAMRERGQKAVDFIVDQGKQYGADVKLYYNQDDLNYTYQYDGEDISEFEYEDYDGILKGLLSTEIDAAAIRKKYNADGIAFLVLINGTGDSFSAPHFEEDGTDYFNEGAYIFLRGYDYNTEEVENGPAIYAYNLLRLFGAVELEAPDPSTGYTTALCNAVHDKYINDIMYTWLDKDGGMNLDTIDKQITDITAYAVDFTDDFSELSANTSFVKVYIASFYDNYEANTADGKEADYDWNPDWDEEDYFTDVKEPSGDYADEDDLESGDWDEEDDEDWDEDDDEAWDDEGWDDENDIEDWDDEADESDEDEEVEEEWGDDDEE